MTVSGENGNERTFVLAGRLTATLRSEAGGIMIALLALAQQQTTLNLQIQEKADKGAKTRQSGHSCYVGEQEEPGAYATLLGRLTLLRRQLAQPPAPRRGRQAAVKGRAERPRG
jgi:hypothetical protein